MAPPPAQPPSASPSTEHEPPLLTGHEGMPAISVWTEDEHKRFRKAGREYPHGPWSLVATKVGTRSVREVISHANKSRQRLRRHARGLVPSGRRRRLEASDTRVLSSDIFFATDFFFPTDWDTRAAVPDRSDSTDRDLEELFSWCDHLSDAKWEDAKLDALSMPLSGLKDDDGSNSGELGDLFESVIDRETATADVEAPGLSLTWDQTESATGAITSPSGFVAPDDWSDLLGGIMGDEAALETKALNAHLASCDDKLTTTDLLGRPPSPRAPVPPTTARASLTNGRVSMPGVGAWTKEEHERFLHAVETHPNGPWSLIAALVGTRNVRQTRTHAQKEREKFDRQERGHKKRGRKRRAECLDLGGTLSSSETSRAHHPNRSPSSSVAPPRKKRRTRSTSDRLL